jgi:hypothetical protein
VRISPQLVSHGNPFDNRSTGSLDSLNDPVQARQEQVFPRHSFPYNIYPPLPVLRERAAFTLPMATDKSMSGTRNFVANTYNFIE